MDQGALKSQSESNNHALEFSLGVKLLDIVYDDLSRREGQVHDIMDELFLGLHDIRNHLSIEEWEYFSRTTIVQHPVRNLLHLDPFTKRTFEKPRGYEGDAKMLDFIYGYVNLKNYNLEPLGKEILDYTTNAAASRAVRARKEIIADAIDSVAENRAKARVFSLACGHLREAHISKAVREKKVHEFIAMDYDKKSLLVVEKEFSSYNVKTMHGSVRDVITDKKKDNWGKFDFIYVAGLYDYLSQRVAMRLTEKLFSMLNKKGKMLICNFLPNIPDVGYMESFMEWRLLYRSQQQLSDLLNEVPEGLIDSKRLFTEENENIVFLEAIKA